MPRRPCCSPRHSIRELRCGHPSRVREQQVGLLTRNQAKSKARRVLRNVQCIGVRVCYWWGGDIYATCASRTIHCRIFPISVTCMYWRVEKPTHYIIFHRNDCLGFKLWSEINQIIFRNSLHRIRLWPSHMGLSG